MSQKIQGLVPGEIVYFKECKRTSANRAPVFQIKGHAIGVLIGEVPIFRKDPPKSLVLGLMGAAGFISLDDIVEFFGEAHLNHLVEKFQEKYRGKQVAPEPSLGEVLEDSTEAILPTGPIIDSTPGNV